MDYKPLSSNTEKKLTAMLRAVFLLTAVSVIIFSFFIFAGRDTAKIFPDGRVNPNTASAELLAELPGIGEKRAQAIVDYRNSVDVNSTKCLNNADDLTKIKGLGKATVDRIKHLLVFE